MSKKSIDVLYIKKPEDLCLVGKLYREKYSGVVLIIDNDIDFNSVNFKPIDASGLSIGIDGRNHTFKNLVIDNGDTMETGLFSKTRNFIVNDLNLVSCSIKGGSCTGTLVGTVEGKAIVDHVSLDSIVEAESHCGGLFGTVKDLEINNITLNGEVKGYDVVGGITGMSKSVAIGCSPTLEVNTKVIAKGNAKNLVSGYNSEEYIERDAYYASEALRYSELKQSPEDIEIVRSLIRR